MSDAATEGSAVLGTGVFATVRGLTVHGAGALADLPRYPQAVELRGRGGDRRALPLGDEEVIFRRVMSYQEAVGGSGRRLDLLGVARARRDESWRPGYIGACAAVAHRDLAAYGEALARARELLPQAEGLLGEASAARWRSDGAGLRELGPSGRRPQHPRVGLDERDASRAHWLQDPDPEQQAAWSLEALRQLAWLDGQALVPVLIFTQPRDGAEPIDAAFFAGCRAAREREYEGLEEAFRAAFERRLAEIEAEYRSALRDHDDR